MIRIANSSKTERRLQQRIVQAHQCGISLCTLEKGIGSLEVNDPGLVVEALQLSNLRHDMKVALAEEQHRCKNASKPMSKHPCHHLVISSVGHLTEGYPAEVINLLKQYRAVLQSRMLCPIVCEWQLLSLYRSELAFQQLPQVVQVS